MGPCRNEHRWCVHLSDTATGARRLCDGPTYRYLFTHVMENDPGLALLRATHTLEESFVWHDFNLFGYSPTVAEEQLSDTMSSYWTNFAKSGDPNGPGLTLWPQYEPAAERYLVLDNQVQVDAAFHIAECDFMDSLDRLFPVCSSLCHHDAAQWRHRGAPTSVGALAHPAARSESFRRHICRYACRLQRLVAVR